MPVMDGLEATKMIREMEADNAHRTPIIGVTAHAAETDAEKCRNAGMDDYVPKPIQRALLVSVIHKWLESRDIGNATILAS